MSIKDLFKDAKTVLNIKSDVLEQEIESKDFLLEKSKEINEYIPEADFSTASNFARYGLAEEYYKQAFSHIYNTFPYDGSEKEITAWKNNLSYLEKYVFNNEYPKTTGYLRLNSGSFSSYVTKTADSINILSSSIGQYVKFFSGPNSGQTLTDGNIYDVSKGRSGNLEISHLSGNTVEFWFKADSTVSDTVKSASAAIFDSWNNVTATGSSDYSRFFIDIKPSNSVFSLTYNVGTDGIERQQFSGSDIYNWHHYAFSVKNSGDKLSIKFYIDGELRESVLTGSDIGNPNLSNLIGNIGAYRYTPKKGNSTFETAANYGQLAGYIDEFRYWKIEKTEKDIARYRFDRVYGGTNTDDSNTDLGIYYRFNEGIVDTSSINTKDSIILDYSGRVSNGTIINYRLNTRSTGSAIDESGLFDSSEPKEPIIYSDNSNVIDKLEELVALGQEWDSQNGNSILRTLPEWIVTEDEEVGVENLRKLSQIIGSYFDKLYLQIKYLPTFNFAEYTQEGQKPPPFLNSIIESNGLSTDDVFSDSTIFELLKNRDENRLYEENLYELKNLIYKNIYNNLTYIYKSKGAEKSFRNLIRCFGIDDELIKLNIYANNTEFELKESKRNSVTSKKTINLSTADNFKGTIFNTTDQEDISAGSSFLVNTLDGASSLLPNYLVPLTFETEIYFPKKPAYYVDGYAVPDSTEISLFGGYTVNDTSSATDYTLNKAQNYFNFEVSLIKNNKDDRGGYFKFNSISTNEVITSSYFSEVYDGENWTFAVRLKTPYESLEKLNYDSTAFSSIPAGAEYTLELYGVNSIENNIKNDFYLTSSAISLSAVQNIHNSGKRFFIGARRENMTGSLEAYTDILVSNARFWYDYVTNEEIQEHSKDSNNYGRTKPIEKPYQNVGEFIERLNTLAFHWDFSDVTASNGIGEAYVKDIKGTVETYNSAFVNNIERRYPAKVSNVLASDTEIINRRYHVTAKQQLPENLFSSDTINIFGDSDLVFTKDLKPVNLFWSFEKSMYQVISEDMLNIFAGITEFNNVIGDPINKYRVEYRDLNLLREKYFSKIQNTPSLEKFIEYYKWIDFSIGEMLNQLVPAGVDVSKNIRTMVESHVLERSKVDYKVPIFQKEIPNYAQIKGIKELNYNWDKGHAPANLNSLTASQGQAASAVWLKERAERSNSQIFEIVDSGSAASRQSILNSIVNDTNRKTLKLYDTKTDTIYDRSSYVDRRLGKVVDFKVEELDYNRFRSISQPYTFGPGIQRTNENIEIRPFLSESSFARTSSFAKPLANYSQKYQLVQIPGREVNKKYLVKKEGVLSSSVASTVVDGLYDYPEENKASYRTVMVTKFSSPGGLEVSSKTSLDRESETFSAYNSINYRNLVARKNLDKWLAETGSYEEETVSYHKTNKNPLRVGNTYKYDNWFITHQIPRSDYGYSWISSSVTGVLNYDSGAYSSIYTNINIGDLSTITGVIENNETIDFLNFNTFITRSIDESSLTVGFVTTSYEDLHKYLLKSNGPFGFPSWKQVRYTANSPLAVKNSRNNRFFIVEESQIGQDEYSSSIKTFVEPPVTYNKPVKILLETINPENGLLENLDLIAEHKSQIQTFSNNSLKLLNSSTKPSSETGFAKLKKINKENLQDETQPKISRLKKREQIFPKKDKTGLAITRTKPNYSEAAGTGSNGYDRKSTAIRTFWKNSVSDRLQSSPFTATNKTGSFNALGFPETSGVLGYNKASGYDFNLGAQTEFLFKSPSSYRFSIWPMDKKLNGAGDTVGTYFSNPIRNFSGDEPILGSLQTTQERYFYFFNQPSGGYSSLTVLDDTSNQYIVETFKYSPETKYRVNPTLLFTYPSNQSAFFGTREPFGRSKIIEYSMEYKTDILSGKKPFYNSYEEFSENIKPLSKQYSLIPEYKISDYMDYIVSSSGGNFRSFEYISTNNGYLKLEGRVNQANIDTVSSVDAINISTEFDEIGEEGFAIEDHKIKLSISGIKKLLPYNGFYPQQRAVQLGDLFLQSTFGLRLGQDIEGFYETSNHNTSSMVSTFSNSVGGRGAPIDAQIQTILQPFFAPGILFNTIKSGIAVDWLTAAISTSSATPYSASARRNDDGSLMIPDVSSSDLRFGLGNGGKGVRLPDFYGIYYGSATSTRYLRERFISSSSDLNLRIPFEGLLTLEEAIPQNFRDRILYLLGPEYYNFNVNNSSEISYDRLNNLRNPSFNLKRLFGKRDAFSQKDQRYKLAMNNFLASTIDFFLEDGKLTGFRSVKQKEIPEFDVSKTYYMDVILRKDDNFSLIVNNLTGALAIDPVFGLGQGRLFGPTTRFFNNITGGTNTSYVEKAIQFDCAYAPWTPPYWLGKSIARISFKPTAKVHSIEEIAASSSIEYINTERDLRFADDSNNMIDESAYGGALNKNYNFSPAYINAMNITSSININLIGNEKVIEYNESGVPILIKEQVDNSENFWSIQTKFETPLLNFNNSLNKNATKLDINDIDGGLGEDLNFFSSSTVGIWSGYGEIPKQGQGIRIGLQESFDYNRTSLSQSLLKHCGFQAGFKDIGKIEDQKEISEAIVLIPYTTMKNHLGENEEYAVTLPKIIGEEGNYKNIAQEDPPYYFKIDKTILSEVIGTSFDEATRLQIQKLSVKPSKNSIQDTMSKMLKYNIPPHLDWITNRTVNPFAMYIFEFKSKLTKQDLADIWQGLMPSLSTNVDMETVSVEHNLGKQEFFHGKKLPEDLKFKIFKVKKKAKINYYSLTDSFIDDKKFSFDFATAEKVPDYSYNWPYDFFSLVEAINVEASVEVEKKTNKE